MTYMISSHTQCSAGYTREARDELAVTQSSHLTLAPNTFAIKNFTYEEKTLIDGRFYIYEVFVYESLQ